MNNSSSIYYAHDYDLKLICPRILDYPNRIFDYIEYVHTFNPDDNIIKKFSNIEATDKKVASFSAYLIFNIINNILDNRSVVKKNIESYYNSQMLAFLKSNKILHLFELNLLANTWKNIDSIINILHKDISKAEDALINHPVYWSDTEDNFNFNIPLILLKDGSVNLYLVLHTDFSKNILSKTEIDYLSIPSLHFVLNHFLSKNIPINSLNIFWLDNSSIESNFKLIKYKDFNSQFITSQTDVQNFVGVPKIGLPNLYNCFKCPYYKNCHEDGILNKHQTKYTDDIEPNYKRIL